MEYYAIKGVHLMCQKCNWESSLALADEMLEDEDERYLFAEDTIFGIRNWIDEKEHVTESQAQTLLNIYGSNN